MGIPSPSSVSTKLQRIAELARQMPGVALTSLSHHVDVDFLCEAYRRTRKDGAVGVDGQTAAGYAVELEQNLRSLLNRFKSGRYVAPAVRRGYVPKSGGKMRPIGIPTFEDKVLQRAVVMLLNAVYEQDFLDCSYGFRPRRSQHQALTALRNQLMEMRGGWVIELDIQSFYDTLDLGHLRRFLDQRVRDGVVRRVIDKWLKAGVLEDGRLFYPDKGTPQGGVVSPVLSNIYLHEVLDLWFERMVKPVLAGQAELIRFADDAVLLFSSERDARRVLQTLPKRFAKYGLCLHPEKTQLVRFHRPSLRWTPDGGNSGPGSFDFLGFTHIWAKSRKGNWVVKQQTATGSLGRAIQRIWKWCRTHRHHRVRWQHAALVSKLRGHYQYYGLAANYRSLDLFFKAVRSTWRYWLNRRGDQRMMPWRRFIRLERQYPLLQPWITQPSGIPVTLRIHAERNRMP